MSTDDMLDLLESVGGVTARRMFGGTGFYKDGIMFALEAYGRLFLKTDAENRGRFVESGCEPFAFEGKNGREMVTSYYEPPESTFSSALKMKPWALLGVEAAMRAATTKPKRKKVKAESKKKTASKKTRKK